MKNAFEIFRINFKFYLEQRAPLIVRIGLFTLILTVFSSLWSLVLQQNYNTGLSRADLTWYLAVTEWIVLSVPQVHLTMDDDLRNGGLIYFLLRPFSYVSMKWVEGLSILLARMTYLGLGGFTIVYFLVGELPSSGWNFLLALPLGIISGAIYSIFQIGVGLSSFWLTDSSPVAWIWQKVGFICGGLILPLSLYPSWLQEVASWTPFYTLLYEVASVVYSNDLSHSIVVLAKLSTWFFVAVFLVEILFRVGTRQVVVGGG